MILTVKARMEINDHVTWVRRGTSLDLPGVASIGDEAFKQGYDRVIVETPNFQGVLEFDVDGGVVRRTGVFA